MGNPRRFAGRGLRSFVLGLANTPLMFGWLTPKLMRRVRAKHHLHRWIDRPDTEDGVFRKDTLRCLDEATPIHPSNRDARWAPDQPPRTFGRKMNSHGLGIGPTGTSIKVGPSRRAKPRRKAPRSSSGERTRSAAAPKLSAKRMKSGLVRSLAISRLP